MTQDADIIKLRATRAKELLEDPVLTLALDTIVRDACTQWAGSDPYAADVREDAYHRVKGVEYVKAALTTFINDQKVREKVASRTR